ncbi:MAG: hypothetical protein WAZ14_00240 [Patescibacteria group bacterium]
MAGLVNQNNANRGVYAQVIKEIAGQAVCPFCPEQLLNFHKRPIRTYGHWSVTDNMYPYQPSKHHILLIHSTHIEHVTELSAQAWGELQTILAEETERRQIPGGTLMLRFGDTHFTGGSVSHLHAHIIQSDPDAPDYDAERGLCSRIG